MRIEITIKDGTKRVEVIVEDETDKVEITSQSGKTMFDTSRGDAAEMSENVRRAAMVAMYGRDA